MNTINNIITKNITPAVVSFQNATNTTNENLSILINLLHIPIILSLLVLLVYFIFIRKRCGN